MAFHYSERLSQRVKPRKQLWIPLPARWFARTCRGVHLLECFSLGLKIGSGVVVGGFQTTVPKQTADNRNVDARCYELDTRRVSEAMGSDAL